MDNKRSGQARYPSELKDRAVRMVQDLRREDPNDKGIITRVARQLGVGSESLRNWVKQSDIDDGMRPGPSTDELAELKRLRKENFELRRANDILQSAAPFFGAELDRRGKMLSPSSTPIGITCPMGVDGGSSRSAKHSRSPPPPTTPPNPARHQPERRETPRWAQRWKRSGSATTRSTDGASWPRPPNVGASTWAATRSSD